MFRRCAGPLLVCLLWGGTALAQDESQQSEPPSQDQAADDTGDTASVEAMSANGKTMDPVGPEGVETPTPEPLYKHFRFQDGEDFVPGPTPTPPIDVDAEAKKLVNEAAENIKKDMPQFDKMLLEAMEAPELAKCTDNKTEAVPMNDSFPEGLEGQNSPAYDMLFIDENDVPEDYETIFGITTLVVPYAKESPNIGWELITDMGVPCIPYRIRFQKDRVFVDSGLNALKNYSKNPNGELHPFIKAKYNIK